MVGDTEAERIMRQRIIELLDDKIALLKKVDELQSQVKEFRRLLKMALGAFEHNNCINWDEIAMAVATKDEI